MPPTPKQTFDSILSSIEAGQIKGQRIIDSFEKIGALHDSVKNAPGVGGDKYQDKQKRAELAMQVAKRSIHDVGEIPNGVRPSSIIIFSSYSPGDSNKVEEILKAFSSSLKVIRLAPGDLMPFEDADNSLFFILDRPRGMLTEEKREKSISPLLQTLVEQVAQSGSIPLGTVLLGNPYLDKIVMKMKPKFLLHAYSDSLPSVLSAIELLKEHIKR
jgi:hypothetical protein